MSETSIMEAEKIIEDKKLKKSFLSEKLFMSSTFSILLIYFIFVVGILASTFFYTDIATIVKSILKQSTLFSIYLSLTTSTITTLLSILIAIPTGYILSRFDFKGKGIINLIIKLPITLPPLVAGLTLLVFFSTSFGQFLQSIGLKFVYTVPGIVLAQFLVSSSFAIITMKATFDEIDSMSEVVARTLGCTRIQSFFLCALPQSKSGIASALVLTWSRAVGEFVPILLFVGAIEGKTDILPIAIFLKVETGKISEGIGLTFVFICICLLVLPLANILTKKKKEA